MVVFKEQQGVVNGEHTIIIRKSEICTTIDTSTYGSITEDTTEKSHLTYKTYRKRTLYDQTQRTGDNPTEKEWLCISSPDTSSPEGSPETP